MSIATTHELDAVEEQYKQIRSEMLQTPISAGVGPFEATAESLQQFQCADWFRDAKFGIWAHWGPQGHTRNGDWYARNMYLQDYQKDQHGHNNVYDYHCEHFGHPSEFGYKDMLPLWKAESFDPEALIKFYKSVGAKYFIALGVHTDNYDCWNSKYHRWNSVNLGPKKDIVGLWRDAARKHGLRFGLSEHVSNYYYWFGISLGADKHGPLAGVPYDGQDERYRDLYNSTFIDIKDKWGTPEDFPEAWAKEWYFRMQDMLDQYEPDLFYTDGAIALGKYSLNILSYYYNRNIQWNGGKLEGVFTMKNHPGLGTYIPGAGVFDIERGLASGITEEPWQIDTCLGNWFYEDGFEYKTPAGVIHFLIDVVSKNGNMMLSVPIRPEGVLDEQCTYILNEIKQWIEVNGEAIYETRPWKTYGEGGVEQYESKCHNEKPLEPQDGEFRFTKKGDTVYAFIMKWPDAEKDIRIQSFAGEDKAIQHVELLGSGPVEWSQDNAGVKVILPAQKPCNYASVLKISC